MFYYLLFFIFIITPQMLQAIIPASEFTTMIAFMRNTDLEHATPAEREQFMTYAQRIAEEGSPEQQAHAETILAEEETHNIIDLAKTTLPSTSQDITLQKIETLLESDIITPEVWQSKVMGPLKEMDTAGTSAEKATLGTFITTHKDRILFHCKKLISSLVYDTHFKEALTFIVVNTIIGILPSLGLKSLSILAGNLPLTSATAQLADLSVLCALDSIVRYGMQGQSEYVTAPIAASVSTAVQDFIGFMGPRPTDFSMFGFTATTNEMATLQAATIVFAKNNLVKQNNITKILNTLDWQELAIGSEQQLVTTSEEMTLMGYLQNALIPVFQNKTVRSITATTVSYALEGALLAAALNIVGLGFYGTSTSAALVAGMTRGALEGLFMHVSQKTTRPGIVQRVSTGFGVLSIQKYLTTGIMGTTMTDLVPLVTQQVLAGAVDGIVYKTGGWKKFVTSLFAK